MNEKFLEQAKELATRPYFIKVIRDETTENEPIYFAQVLELEGCFGQGETPEAAVSDLQLAMVDYIASLLEDGLPVPNPADLVTTTSSTSNETLTITNFGSAQNTEYSPQRNIYIPAL